MSASSTSSSPSLATTRKKREFHSSANPDQTSRQQSIPRTKSFFSIRTKPRDNSRSPQRKSFTSNAAKLRNRFAYSTMVEYPASPCRPILNQPTSINFETEAWIPGMKSFSSIHTKPLGQQLIATTQILHLNPLLHEIASLKSPQW